MREWTRAEVAGTTEPHIIIDNAVYAVQRWLEEHPGGPDVLLDNAGKDATQCFVKQGHSAEARVLMGRFEVGTVVEAERWPEIGARLAPAGSTTSAEVPKPEELETEYPVEECQDQETPLQWLLSLLSAAGPPLVMGALAILFYSYVF